MPSPSPSTRVIGTLVVVVLKANHLPNKRHIGKQDPYCVVSVNGDKRRTKAIKRGGQHPEWDEEIRFEIQEALETADEDGNPPPPPPKPGKAMKNVKIEGGRTMKIACYADDPREPDFIGDADVDLTEVLTKGECDEWFTLNNKDKFAGKVYLELTFWSNDPPPDKKSNTKTTVTKNDKQYGGPGSFIASNDVPPSLRAAHQSRIASTSVVYDHSRRQSDSIPYSMRTSTSLAQLDLYSPPYETAGQASVVDDVTRDFSELGVIDVQRRESYPPPHAGYVPRTSYPPATHTYEPSNYAYDRPLTPPGQINHNLPPASYQAPYQPAYESAPPPSSYNPPRPRYSIPSTSSGFVSISNSTSSGFAPLPSHGTEPSTFGIPQSHTPVPSIYSQSGFAPPPPQTPMPPSSYTPHPIFPPQHSYTYPPYGVPPGPTPIPSATASLPPPQLEHQQQPTQPPQHHLGGYPSGGSPAAELAPAPLVNGAPVNGVGASRPLPQPNVYANHHVQPNYTPPTDVAHYSPPPNSQFSNFAAVPPPPPLPSVPEAPSPPQSTGFQPLPVPPPPPIEYNPPVDYQPPTHPVYPPGPPPPPPPLTQSYPGNNWAAWPPN